VEDSCLLSLIISDGYNSQDYDDDEENLSDSGDSA
jgi:hypothetical protein